VLNNIQHVYFLKIKILEVNHKTEIRWKRNL